VAALATAPRANNDRAEAAQKLGLNPEQPILVVLGGSLGARAINQAVETAWPQWTAAGIQVVWQCGALYHEAIAARLPQNTPGLQLTAFVQDMTVLYRAADLVISRAGAGTLSELACAGVPAVLVPSPNVAEDHQTHNARAFERAGAAVLLPETQLSELNARILELMADDNRRAELSTAARSLALPNATEAIVEHIVQAL
jgi:UDP-N-acetylglucosamine--N-acetylmuramyl-(pentapeptide) pyrophosphoryl-undecaprenol N-acetylglucosamine transferase